jgi:hypothetical protein
MGAIQTDEIAPVAADLPCLHTDSCDCKQVKMRARAVAGAPTAKRQAIRTSNGNSQHSTETKSFVLEKRGVCIFL